MNNEIFQFLNQFLSEEWAVFFTAALPVVELRGAIPLAIALGLRPWNAYWIAVAGNAFPVIPLLLLLHPVRVFLIERSKLMTRFFGWLDRRVMRKKESVEKYGFLALVMFTAIPFPSTGAWTASLAALLFNIKFKHAFPAIIIGIFIAGILMLFLSVGGKMII